MAAGVHPPLVVRAVGERIRLEDVQSVHVGAERDGRPRPLRARQRPDDAGPAEPAVDGNAERGEPGGDEIAGRMLLEGGFGIFMDVAAPARHLGLEFGDPVDDGHGEWSRRARSLSSARRPLAKKPIVCV